VFTTNKIFEPLTTHQSPVFTPVKAIGYSGIGQTLDRNNPFVFPILNAETSTVCVNNEEDTYSKTNGAQLTLVSGYQSRNNHRAVFTGSLSICSNELYGTDGVDN